MAERRIDFCSPERRDILIDVLSSLDIPYSLNDEQAIVWTENLPQARKPILEDQVRVLRVVEVTGPRLAVEKHLRQAKMNGEFRQKDGVVIRIATLGDFPEILNDLPPAEPSTHRFDGDRI